MVPHAKVNRPVDFLHRGVVRVLSGVHRQGGADVVGRPESVRQRHDEVSHLVVVHVRTDDVEKDVVAVGGVTQDMADRVGWDEVETRAEHT